MDEKKSGSYYTPESVVRFMTAYLTAHGQEFHQVLEPAAGDGRFLPMLLHQLKDPIEIDAVELFEEKVRDMRSRVTDFQVCCHTADFLEYAWSCEKKYDLIIGNPPYVNLKNMEDSQIKKARELFQWADLGASVMQNLWSAFVVGAVKLLTAEGTIFFVLPAEFLQVQFAEKLRLFLEERFNNIKIFTFEINIFPDIEQQTCLVYLSNSESAPPYIDYYVYGHPEENALIKHSRIEKSKPLKKWSNAILDDEEILLLHQSGRDCVKIEQLGICAPGIVTGGNKYFIVRPSFVKATCAEQYVLPVIQKSSLLKEETIFFNKKLFQSLEEADTPVYLLDLAGKESIPPGVAEYLNAVGEVETNGIRLKERHKCSKRSPWYAVPVVHDGDVVFFKRSDKLPRFYINEERIHTTDAGYHIRLNKQYDSDSVVFCFYNSLTLALCEFNGRYYGGGVLELIPSEFKELVLPYVKIDKKDVQKLDDMFRQQASMSEIISFVNSKTLVNFLSAETIQTLNTIREKLMKRRLR